MKSPPRPAVILVRPQEEGNVGAVARAMANMGLGRLILVEPAAELGGVARGFGVGGWEVLDGAERVASLAAAVAPFHRLVGTSSSRERPLAHARVLTPRELPPIIAADSPETSTALIFGPEDNGLTRQELELCHLVVTVPCVAEHPTLNLAQGVLIVAYELRAAATRAASASGAQRPLPPPATVAEIDGLLAATSRLLHRLEFDHQHIHRGLLRDLRRLLARSEASSTETRILRRLVNRTLRRLGEAHPVVLRHRRPGCEGGQGRPRVGHPRPRDPAEEERRDPQVPHRLRRQHGRPVAGPRLRADLPRSPEGQLPRGLRVPRAEPFRP